MRGGFGWAAVLLALVAGLAAGLLIRGRQARAAEAHAARAAAQYDSAAAREALYQRERVAAATLRAAEQTRADSTARAADTALTAAQARAAGADRRAAARIAAAVTVEQQRDTYRELYQETLPERDNFALTAMAEQRAAGQLRALAREDSVTLAKSDARGNRWKQTADSLMAAQQDLLAHRPSGITIQGLGLGAGLGGAAVAAVCLLTPAC